MKLVIAGSRGIRQHKYLNRLIDNLVKFGFDPLDITEIVSGTADGSDKLGEAFAIANDIPLKKMPADWNKGKGAGHIRNREMAEYCDAALILWDGTSPGTKGMIKEMQRVNKPYMIDVVFENV